MGRDPEHGPRASLTRVPQFSEQHQHRRSLSCATAKRGPQLPFASRISENYRPCCLQGHFSAPGGKVTSPRPQGSAVAEQSQILGVPSTIPETCFQGRMVHLGRRHLPKPRLFSPFIFPPHNIWTAMADGLCFPTLLSSGFPPAALTPLYRVAFHLGKDTKQKCY